MLKRWISATFWLAVFVTGFGAASWFFAPQIPDVNVYLLLGAGVVAFLITLLLFLIRKSAYLQLHPDHLRIVTPFMRVKVGYKRIQRTYTADMNNLFPSKKVRGMRREIIAPFMKHTAIVLNLISYPLPRWILHAFLSDFFFIPKDKSPHFILLMDNWLYRLLGGPGARPEAVRLGALLGPSHTLAAIAEALVDTTLGAMVWVLLFVGLRALVRRQLVAALLLTLIFGVQQAVNSGASLAVGLPLGMLLMAIPVVALVLLLLYLGYYVWVYYLPESSKK